MKNKPWTREEEILALSLYRKIPFHQVSQKNSEVIRLANLIGRSPCAVKMKIGNLANCDDALATVGLSHTSKLDAEIWAEFNNRWDELAIESQRIITLLQKNSDESL